ncbi:MAG TPA: hypothetical protein VIU87_26680 [Mycobacterium sp.]
MAETRKYQPSSNAVGDAIRAALGETVRPVTPGSTPAPATKKPTEAVTVRTFTFGAGSRAAEPEDEQP